MSEATAPTPISSDLFISSGGMQSAASLPAGAPSVEPAAPLVAAPAGAPSIEPASLLSVGQKGHQCTCEGPEGRAGEEGVIHTLGEEPCTF